jgi:cyclopropane-fatty-acyl-phospholipid synthase
MIETAERVPLPDLVIRVGIKQLCARTALKLAECDIETDAAFAHEMATRAVAEHTDAANTQHYEVPAEFFALVLGPNKKYSSCFYKESTSTLQEA